MAEAEDSAGHTPLTPEWTPAPVPLPTHRVETGRARLLHSYA